MTIFEIIWYWIYDPIRDWCDSAVDFTQRQYKKIVLGHTSGKGTLYAARDTSLKDRYKYSGRHHIRKEAVWT